jgi:hypothetical protein
MKKAFITLIILGFSIVATAQLQYQTTLLTTTTQRGKIVKPQITVKNIGTSTMNLTWKANDKATYIPQGFNPISICLYPAGLCFQYNTALFTANSNRDFSLPGGDSVFFLVDMDVTNTASLDSTCNVGILVDEGTGVSTAIAFAINAVNWPTVITNTNSNINGIYPNKISTTAQLFTSNATQEIIITNIYGQMVRKIKPTSNTEALDASQFTNGQYIATFIEANGIKTSYKFNVARD